MKTISSPKLTNAVLDGRIEGIDNRRTSMSHPVGLVYGFSQFIKSVVRSENIHIQHRLQIAIRVDFQIPIIFLQLLIVHDLVRISDVGGHRIGLVERRQLCHLVHPFDFLEDLRELGTDTIDHLQGSGFRVLFEVLSDIQGANGYRETELSWDKSGD